MRHIQTVRQGGKSVITGLQLGLYTLGDHIADPITKKRYTATERIHNIVEMATLAEQAGFDIFQVGESHQPMFVSQGHLVLLGAIAQATSTIRLSSGATIIGVADPVRVYEEAATIDLISNGRMELLCGRSARTGIYETLGYDLNDYEALFEEKFQLLKLINQREFVTWSGEYRTPLNNVQILPRSIQAEGLPIWRAVGGSLASAEQAGRNGDAICVMDYSWEMERYRSLIQHYRNHAMSEGHEVQQLPVAIAGYLFAHESNQQAIDAYYPYVKAGSMQVNNQTIDKQEFQQADQLSTLINVGSPSFIVEKMLKQYEELGHQRFIGHIDFGGVSFESVKRTLTLLGEQVVPQIKKYTK
ncbi:LLM class flavin-dependent oxidoreductase [Tuanshanicoccus lijuaniae]|nr:LLM class flavin-dependent oxidoreductase [Aerococcaceae bacterium zg-1292]QQA37176.1 LLM class flavin-dependent oxidoreductase [Aerococcaceae bacterium zg-1292]